ncbi:site-specific integrase [Thalassospira australica]|uniref:site-specific integrase n=1 Tax=Thalassospira australica TaxID=1528106 RepID=UPI00138E486C|nr:site-specific integrase [Thalassospira australica]
MSLRTNVVRIGSRYYYRQRIPADLRVYGGPEAIKMALGTANPLEARERALEAALAVASFFRNLRMSKSEDDNEIITMTKAQFLNFKSEIRQMYMEEVGNTVKQAKKSREKDKIIQEERNTFTRMLGNNSYQNSQENLNINKIFSDFMVEKEKTIAPKYYNFHMLVLDIFLKICGDKSVSEYKRKDMVNFRGAIISLPIRPDRYLKNYETDNPVEVLKKLKGNESLISKETYNGKYHAVMSSFFNYCVEQEYLKVNPFKNGKFSFSNQEQIQKLEDERQPYSTDELNAIFQSEKFVNRHRDKTFFCPLIALFSGMRLGEIAQLRPKDIIEHNGMLNFNLFHSKTKIKTISGYRIVPIHHELIKLGLLDYIEEQKKRHKTDDKFIFDIRYNEKMKEFDGRFWGRFLKPFKDNGTVRGQVVFHSFRSNFRDGLESLGAKDSTIDQIIGHSSSKQKLTRRYSDKKLKQIQSDLVQKVSFSGLDLSHLYK